MDRPLAAFDIETVPDVEIGRRLMGLRGDFMAVADGMQALRLEETEGRTDFLKPPYHRIVAISVAWYDHGKRLFKLDSLGDGTYSDEGALIEGFARILDRKHPRLVSWNGNGFDLPVIRYRGMLHGIDLGPYYEGTGDRFNGYLNRYHDLHTDLMDVLAGFGASAQMGLDDMCRVFGLPGKTVTEGHRVFQHIARGEWELVQTYCQLDALNTLMLYLAYARSRGRLPPFQFREACGLIGEAVAGDPRPDVANYGAEVAAWELGTTRSVLATELGDASPA